MNNRRSFYRAFSLVEMMVVISVGSVLMGLALGMVHRTMRAESLARSHAQVERTTARLSRQFRHDIHVAESFTLEDQQADMPLLRLTLPDQQPITYRIENNSLLRQQQHSDEQTYRELFSFPDNYVLQFAELTEPTRATLTLRHDTKLVGIEPQIKLHVEAVLGQFQLLRQSEEVSQ